jgi:hypothetical protein
VFIVECEVRLVRSSAGEEAAVFGSVRDGCMVVFGVVYMYAWLRLVYLWGAGSPRIWGMRVYGHVQVPIDTSEPEV